MVLSSTHVVIEQTFGLLKGRFRWLKYLDMLDIKLAAEVVAAACILHNLCINNNDEADVEKDVDVVHRDPNNDDNFDEGSNINVGFVKRDQIAAALQL